MSDGRIQKGERRSPGTEFKPGTHWREPKPYYERTWLLDAYVARARSSGDIAKEFGVTEAAIIFWLRKHEIPRRSISSARAVKRWGASGKDNPMFGKTGKQNGNWKGGCTPDRQAFYSSLEWADASKVVWERDAGTCQRCGLTGSANTLLNIHHIVSFSVKSLRAEPSNLVLLCTQCHNFVHSKKNINHEFIESGEEVQ